MAVTSVTSGETSSFLSANNGDGIIVYNGGTADNSEIGPDGYQLVSSGGSANFTVLSGNQTSAIVAGSTVYTQHFASQTVYAGGSTTSETINGGYAAETLSGGTSISAFIISGAIQYALSGASTTGTIIGSGGGYQEVASGATAAGTVIFEGQQDLGGTVFPTNNPDGVTFAAGDANYTTVTLTTDSSGNVLGFGAQDVYAGGVASNTLVSGGTGPGTTTGNYEAQQYILSGATGVNALIEDYGFQLVQGTVSGTVVSGGEEYVFSGGVATGTIATSFPNGFQGINGIISAGAGAEVLGATVMSGGIAAALGNNTAGALISGATISSSGVLKIGSAGSGLSNVLLSGATEIVSSGNGTGGYVSGTIVNLGAKETLAGTAQASGTVLKGGQIVVSGLAIGTKAPVISGLVFNPGASIDIVSSSYASTDAVSINTSDVLTLKNGSTTIFSAGLSGSYTSAVFSATNDGNGHILITETGLVNALVGSGVTSTIYSGAIASNTHVSGGGTLILSGGSAIGTVLSGNQTSSTVGSTTTYTQNYASETVYTGGSTTSETITDYWSVETLSGGTSLDAFVISGASQYLSSGATATSAAVSGGTQYVWAGAATSNASLVSGGAQWVGSSNISGGIAVSTTIGSASYQVIESGGLASGTIISGGTQYVENGGSATSTTVEAGGNQTLVGTGAVAVSTTVSGGTETVSSGSVASNTTLETANYVTVMYGGKAINPVLISGILQVTGATTANAVVSGATVDSGAAVHINLYASGMGDVLASGATQVDSRGYDSGTIVNNGAKDILIGSAHAIATTISGGGELILSSANQTPVVSGLIVQNGGSIDIAYLAYNSAEQVNVTSTGLLTVTGGAAPLSEQLAGSYAGEYFSLASDGGTAAFGSAGVLLTETTTPCYCPGTLIATETGDVPVEALAIGDRLLTISGDMRAIKWIGKRSYGGRFILGRKDIQPICIKAGALDENSPLRDLWVSPHHAMYLDGVLIEAKDLVNGVSVIQSEQGGKVEYYHVELDSHDVILAEGAWAESYIDDDSRAIFHNAHEFALLYPDAASGFAVYCAPRIEDGPVLEAIHSRIGRRTGLAATATESLGALRGQMDHADDRVIRGWAQNAAHPSVPVCLDILVNGTVVAQTLANLYRPDLAEAGIGTGHHSFEAALPAALASSAPHVIEVRRSVDGASLGQSPWPLTDESSAAA